MAKPQGGDVAPALLHVYPSAERTAVEPLDGDTVALIVWFRGESQIQVSDVMPPGHHAAVIRHVARARHLHICCARHCAQARAWLTEFAPNQSVYAPQTA